MTTITGTLFRPDGTPAAGARLTLELREAFTTPGAITLAGSASVTADAEGRVTISVKATPEDAEYRLELHDHGRRVHTQTITVPDCPEVELTDLLDGLEGFVCE